MKRPACEAGCVDDEFGEQLVREGAGDWNIRVGTQQICLNDLCQSAQVDFVLGAGESRQDTADRLQIDTGDRRAGDISRKTQIRSASAKQYAEIDTVQGGERRRPS
ncbi:MAG: hypothetical protein R3C19_16355 [Planctomycetaceae bacterium]